MNHALQERFWDLVTENLPDGHDLKAGEEGWPPTVFRAVSKAVETIVGEFGVFTMSDATGEEFDV